MSIQLMALLTFHLFCNAVAEMGPLSHGEAHECSANFEELKVALNPNLSMRDYDRLSPRERAEAGVASYRYYRAWVVENAALYDHLKAQADLNVRLAGF